MEEAKVVELLYQTGQMLASNLDLERIVQAVTDAGTALSGAAFGAFFYTAQDAEGGVFQLYTLSGAPREAFAKFPHPRSTPVFAPTFEGQGVIRLDDVTKDPRYGQWAPHHGMPKGHLPVCSYLAVPVVSRSGAVIGGLFFGHQACGVFGERAERLVVGLAAQAAVAIDNARLYDEAKRAAADRARMLESERALRAEIERVSLMKDEFLATLSHELRTPMTAVLGWTELLLARAGDADKRGLETIARNARAQSQLIDDLLDMNRIVSGKIRLDVQQVDLPAIVDAAIESVRPSAEAKSIAVRATIDPYAGHLYGDPNRLQQVVWNLLTNAVKFTPRDGKIDVIVRRVNSHVEVLVQDSGAGIAPEFLPHVFERFRQADSSITRRHGGLGLGLSIVKHLIELHGGSVEAESDGLDRGSTFAVHLPLRAVRDPVAQVAHPTSAWRTGPLPVVSLAGVSVLIVEDEPDARELIQEVLGRAGAVVYAAASAADGLAALRAHRPDVLVSDIGLPGRDGYDLIGDVRALAAEEGGHTPAIALTAFARSEDRTRALLAGYQVHVTKPIEPTELLATVRSLRNRG